MEKISRESLSSPRPPVTAGDIMRPALTAVEPNDHLAAAAYLMKHKDASALVVVDGAEVGRPVGVITEADIVQAVADGKNLNDVRILALMTSDPTVVRTTTSVHEAARAMVAGRFRHLPVVGNDDHLRGMIDILEICDALLDC